MTTGSAPEYRPRGGDVAPGVTVAVVDALGVPVCVGVGVLETLGLSVTSAGGVIVLVTVLIGVVAGSVAPSAGRLRLQTAFELWLPPKTTILRWSAS